MRMHYIVAPWSTNTDIILVTLCLDVDIGIRDTEYKLLGWSKN